MSAHKPLDRLAESYGIQLRYLSETREWRAPCDQAKRVTLAAMGVEAGDAKAIKAALSNAPAPQPDELIPPEGVCCHLPRWLRDGRTWGVTCQLYSLRSPHNHGIGDFEDLAVLAETVASDGADFVGVNPLHALFTADPARCSPFSPSSRRFLNPLYIALGGIPGLHAPPAVDEAERLRLAAAHHVDYVGAARLKMAALRDVWSRIASGALAWKKAARASFEAFVEEGGEDLLHHAWFEALSHAMTAAGYGSGWHGWPEGFRDAARPAVRRFAEENADEARFHLWLQWLADEQLSHAKRRARAAGMRIGLYLDFAVGTAPDGSASWSDPELVVAGARVGSPPDAFSAHGQDWGLTPLSPSALRSRRMTPYRSLLGRAMRHAGALRIDHAMSLYRLYWIPGDLTPDDGCYVLYPLQDMLRVLAEASNANRTVIIGEDLGTVPEGFHELIQAIGMMSCVVLYFEQDEHGFVPAETYPPQALASVSTHDLPPLAAWWAGKDIALGIEIGQIDTKLAGQRRRERARERAALLAHIRGGPRGRALSARRAEPMTPSLAAEIHRFLARTPSRLFGVQLDDLCGFDEPVNMPGTADEYPNWRQRLPVEIGALREGPFYRAVVDAVADERAKP